MDYKSGGRQLRAGLIPFFVADRPASLQILKGVMLRHPEIKVGVMTHAFTSKNFGQMFNNFPNNLSLLYEDISLLGKENVLTRNLIKMADSGIFSKNGCTIDYKELFKRYNRLGVDFGVIIDVFKDPRETVKSARKGLEIYTKNKDKYHFKLVAVAQGNTVKEYLKCYDKLKSLGFNYIAIGGLLKKIINSARYVKVRDENFMYQVLTAIKDNFSPEELFALGCYHRSRHKKFEEIGVWGSDYKGWIFNYTSKIDYLKNLNDNLTTFDLNNGFANVFKNLLKHVEELEIKLTNLKKNWRQEKNTSIKKEIWTNINLLKIKLKRKYTTLLRERQHVARCNHLPLDYKENLNNFEGVISMGEQEWRFRQVRKYIEKNVYAQLR